MIRRLGGALSTAALCGSLLAGCSLAPPYHRPELPVPPSWPVGDAYLRQSETALPRYDYRQVFADPRLLTLIGQALTLNQDVARAAANIAAARAQYRIQRAQLFPELDATASFRHSGGSGSSGVGSGGTGSSGSGSSFTADLAVTGYEVDLFGRIRSLTSAAQARYFGTAAAARATRLALVADIAQTWLQHASDASLLDVARKTVATQRASVNLTRRRVTGGIAPRSDLDQAEITLHTAEADVANDTTAVAQDIDALQLLVGAPIDPALLSSSIEDAAARFALVPAGLDSSVLLRRPDVVEAEWTLRAANADIGAARAQLFPKITLTGLLGFASRALLSLFTGGAFSWSIGANASYPIFRAGAGRATVALSEAQRNAALADYRKAIESAFKDVSDALARAGTIEAQLTAIRANVRAAGDNLKLANMRYRGGIESYLTSLTAQQAYYNAQRTLVNAELLRASNRIALYRSLGGDSPGS